MIPLSAVLGIKWSPVQHEMIWCNGLIMVVLRIAILRNEYTNLDCDGKISNTTGKGKRYLLYLYYNMIMTKVVTGKSLSN